MHQVIDFYIPAGQPIAAPYQDIDIHIRINVGTPNITIEMCMELYKNLLYFAATYRNAKITHFSYVFSPDTNSSLTSESSLIKQTVSVWFKKYQLLKEAHPEYHSVVTQAAQPKEQLLPPPEKYHLSPPLLPADHPLSNPKRKMVLRHLAESLLQRMPPEMIAEAHHRHLRYFRKFVRDEGITCPIEQFYVIGRLFARVKWSQIGKRHPSEPPTPWTSEQYAALCWGRRVKQNSIYTQTHRHRAKIIAAENAIPELLSQHDIEAADALVKLNKASCKTYGAFFPATEQQRNLPEQPVFKKRF